jgi:putative ABC transport system substrate-binding protein
MRRRDVIAIVVAGSVVSWPLELRSQQNRIPRVAVLWHAGSAEEEAIYLGAFVGGMKGLGYIDGKTVALDHRFPNEIPERFKELAVELVAQAGCPGRSDKTRSSRGATGDLDYTNRFRRRPRSHRHRACQQPGTAGRQYHRAYTDCRRAHGQTPRPIQRSISGGVRVALLVNANDRMGMHRYVDEFQSAAAKLNLTFQRFEVRSLGEFEQAFDKMSEERLEGIFLAPDGLFYQGRERLAQLATARRLPFVVHSREMLDARALMSYGPDLRAIFRRSATYVHKILKGEKPADLPVEQPTNFEFLFNLKTAKVLGLTIPEVLLLRADRIIE